MPDLDHRITTGRTRRDLVVMIEANAVVRVLRNPGGYTSETAGDYSFTIPDTDWRLFGITPGEFTITPAISQPRYAPECW